MASIKNLVYYKCDITDRDAVIELSKKVAKEHGNPSILVNNAGVANAAPIMKVTDKQLKQLFDVNIISHYYTIQAFMPNMIKENKGHIFSTASVASFMAAPGLVPYSNTKASVLALHEGLSFETRAVWKAPSIKFSIIHPTFIDTAMAAPFKTNLKDAGAGIITPETVANAAVKQILSCRSGQIILPGNLGQLVNVRKWPKWMYYGAFYIGDRRTLVSGWNRIRDKDEPMLTCNASRKCHQRSSLHHWSSRRTWIWMTAKWRSCSIHAALVGIREKSVEVHSEIPSIGRDCSYGHEHVALVDNCVGAVHRQNDTLWTSSRLEDGSS
jgi:short-subunit dehydrogenase